MLSRVAAQSVALAIEAVRRKLGDPSTAVNGQLIPEGLRRHSDDAIFEALNETWTEMGTEMDILSETNALDYVDTTYTEGADSDGMRLPAGVRADGVTHVQDISNAQFPIRLPYVSPLEIDDFVDPIPDGVGAAFRYYSLLSDGDATAVPPARLKIRPTASGRTIRIWVAAAPLVAGTIGDLSPLSGRWAGHATTFAAVKLMAIDDEVPAALAALHARQMEQFGKFASKNRGREHIPSARIRSS